jgi:DNA-binding HxlR family transcriptional regulator
MAEQRPIIASSVIRAINIIGDRWTLYILRDAFLGARRYFEWKSQLRISDAVLSDRLRKLVDAGCLAKQPSSTSETHEEYYLTDKGLDLYHVLICLWHWDTTWNPNRAKAVQLIHRTCGKATFPIVACDHCKKPVRARDIEFVEGAGAGTDHSAPIRRRRTQKFDPLDIVGNEALTILGDRWSALLVACSFLGLRRFKALQERMNIPPHQLSVRLKELVASSILERSLYQKHPARHEYRLTGKGRDFYPVILMLMTWGDRWLSQPIGPPVILRHRPCGVELEPVMICAECGDPVDRRNVYFSFLEEREAVS